MLSKTDFFSFSATVSCHHNEFEAFLPTEIDGLHVDGISHLCFQLSWALYLIEMKAIIGCMKLWLY